MIQFTVAKLGEIDQIFDLEFARSKSSFSLKKMLVREDKQYADFSLIE